MVALDKLTGEPRWSCSRPGDRGAGHASIVISNVGGTKVYVQSTGSGFGTYQTCAAIVDVFATVA